MIHFEGALAPHLYRRALGSTGRSMQVVAWMLILASVVNFRFANLAQPVSWAMPLFIGTFGAMLLLAPRLTVKRAFATDRLLSEAVTGEADEQGVRMESAHGRSDLPWTLMHKVVVAPNVVTIYQSAGIIRILPREFFADDESWEAFRRLASAVPSAEPSPRPIRVFLLWIVIIVVVFVLWSLFKAA
jgi:YcxB-like protein